MIHTTESTAHRPTHSTEPVTGLGEILLPDQRTVPVTYALQLGTITPHTGRAASGLSGIVLPACATPLPLGEVCHLVLADGQPVRVVLRRLFRAAVTYAVQVLDSTHGR